MTIIVCKHFLWSYNRNWDFLWSENISQTINLLFLSNLKPIISCRNLNNYERVMVPWGQCNDSLLPSKVLKVKGWHQFSPLHEMQWKCIKPGNSSGRLLHVVYGTMARLSRLHTYHFNGAALKYSRLLCSITLIKNANQQLKKQAVDCNFKPIKWLSF